MKLRLFIIVGLIMPLLGCDLHRHQQPLLCWAYDQEPVRCPHAYYKDGQSAHRVLKKDHHCPKPVHCDDQYHYDDVFYHNGTASFDSYHVKRSCAHCGANLKERIPYF